MDNLAQLELRIAKARSAALVAQLEQIAKFDPDQPRDKEGRWSRVLGAARRVLGLVPKKKPAGGYYMSPNSPAWPAGLKGIRVKGGQLRGWWDPAAKQVYLLERKDPTPAVLDKIRTLPSISVKSEQAALKQVQEHDKRIEWSKTDKLETNGFLPPSHPDYARFTQLSALAGRTVAKLDMLARELSAERAGR